MKLNLTPGGNLVGVCLEMVIPDVTSGVLLSKPAHGKSYYGLIGDSLTDVKPSFPQVIATYHFCRLCLTQNQ